MRFMPCIVLWIERMNDVTVRVANSRSEQIVYKG